MTYTLKIDKRFREALSLLQNDNYKWQSGDEPLHFADIYQHRQLLIIDTNTKRLCYGDYMKEDYVLIRYEDFLENIIEKLD